ncbi:TlpA family protein disulfide reductase [bacterium]|nr:MAG: TlpA family protein disulfide reductase [bacterium]
MTLCEGLLNIHNMDFLFVVSEILIKYQSLKEEIISIKPIVVIFSVLFLASHAHAQNVHVVSFQELVTSLNKQNDTTYVFNFWATWCSPCVEELPHFETVNETYKNEKLQVVLISLDFKSELEKKVIPFVKKKNIRSAVVLLDEPDANSYIDKVSPEWSGAIPATLIVNSKKNIRVFYEKKFSLEELQSLIQSIIERN